MVMGADELVVEVTHFFSAPLWDQCHWHMVEGVMEELHAKLIVSLDDGTQNEGKYLFVAQFRSLRSKGSGR